MNLIKTLRTNLWWRKPVHQLICKYLRTCGGTFHTYPYGPTGRYVVLMTDDQYHKFRNPK